jgi:hypothetical protein
MKDLTQIEEMLIACALWIMKVCIKRGGQRGYTQGMWLINYKHLNSECIQCWHSPLSSAEAFKEYEIRRNWIALEGIWYEDNRCFMKFEGIELR